MKDRRIKQRISKQRDMTEGRSRSVHPLALAILLVVACPLFTWPWPVVFAASPECVFRVDGGYSGGIQDGKSWSTPFSSIQDGIDAAYDWVTGNSNNPCEVWVAKGTYYVYKISENDTINLRPAIAVFGGFDGSEYSRDDRDWRNDLTILDGRQSSTTGAPRVYHVVTANTGTSALIDGFTIRHGRARQTAEGFPDNVGGGLLTKEASPMVRNCTFERNSAYQGAAVYMYRATSLADADDVAPAIVSSVFQYNEAKSAGGAVTAFANRPTIQNCTFTRNHGGGRGGAIYTRFSNALIREVTFSQNKAKRGGAIYTHEHTTGRSPTIYNGAFFGNEATYGGAVYNNKTSASGSAPKFVNCTMSANDANWGGAIYNNRSDPTIINSILWHNSPTEIVNAEGGSASVSYSNVEGGYPGLNLSVDPKFRDPTSNDYRLAADSPMVDAGLDSPDMPEVDVRLQTRQWADIGAYELAGGSIAVWVIDLQNNLMISDPTIRAYSCAKCEPIEATAGVPVEIASTRREKVIKLVVEKTGYHSRTLYKKVSPQCSNVFIVEMLGGPTSPDSDFDGLEDAFEDLIDPGLAGHPPLKTTPDYDGDGLLDGWEVNGAHWVDYSSYKYTFDINNDWLENAELNPPPSPGRIEVAPIFFRPMDAAEVAVNDEQKALMLAQMRLAQARYRDWLTDDTFRISSAPEVYDARHNHYYYCRDFLPKPYTTKPTRAMLMMGEFLQRASDHLDTNMRTYVALYVHPANAKRPTRGWQWQHEWTYLDWPSECEAMPLGGGIPLGNVKNEDGTVHGGFVHMKSRTLSYGIHFQSTLVHELGHTFGLPHSWARGTVNLAGENDSYSIMHKEKGPSIMSYNIQHHSLRLAPKYGSDWHDYRRDLLDLYDTSDLGTLTPEDYFVIDNYASSMFPYFRCTQANAFCDPVCRPYKSQTLTVGAMYDDADSDKLSEFDRRRVTGVDTADGYGTKGIGYELFWNGVRVGHEPYWRRSQAMTNCEWNDKTHTDRKVECRWEGTVIGYELYWDGIRVGYEPTWTRLRGKFNCDWNNRQYPAKRVECSFGGAKIGYELYYDGDRIRFEPLWSLASAKEDCQWNVANHPQHEVNCYWRGEKLGYEVLKDGVRQKYEPGWTEFNPTWNIQEAVTDCTAATASDTTGDWDCRIDGHTMGYEEFVNGARTRYEPDELTTRLWQAKQYCRELMAESSNVQCKWRDHRFDYYIR